jgi:hypothetical protein
MEIDGYCEELSLGFECQGEQHYIQIGHFHRQDGSLERRMQDDHDKINLCALNKISIIEIPFHIENIFLLKYIEEKILYLRPNIRLNQNVEFRDFQPSDELSTIKFIAEKNGGVCLSDSYNGIFEKYKFRCELGHEWMAMASNIKRGTWCPLCKPKILTEKRRIHDVDSMREIAKKKNGKFLSNFFNSVNDKYRWACSESHEWIAAPSDIMKGTWCRKCAFKFRQIPIERAQISAQERGGVCLSTEILNAQAKLKWKCSKGHVWEARLSNILHRNSWCPICAREKTRRIQHS